MPICPDGNDAVPRAISQIHLYIIRNKPREPEVSGQRQLSLIHISIKYARKGSVIVLVAVFAGMATIDLAVANDHEPVSYTHLVAIYTAIRQFEMEYAKLVAEIRKQDEKKSKEKQSIWVEASKEYIFKHLHEKIRVQEIADYLPLNSSYLSELFKQQESMTLTDFCLLYTSIFHG